MINLEEVRNRFVATSDNLFNFILNYDFLKEVDFNERVTIFCQIISQFEEELEIKYNGPKIDIGFNVTYLIDVLTNIQSEKLSFAFKDSSSSCLITIPKNDNYKYVVMPMRI